MRGLHPVHTLREAYMRGLYPVHTLREAYEKYYTLYTPSGRHMGGIYRHPGRYTTGCI